MPLLIQFIPELWQTERMVDSELECGELENFFLSQPADEILPITDSADVTLIQNFDAQCIKAIGHRPIWSSCSIEKES